MDEDGDEIAWQSTGHKWIGRRLRWQFHNGGCADGTITMVRMHCAACPL
jgi:hypothetical protein